MIVKYEGTDITRHITLIRCVWDAREEGRVPQLSIEFDDQDGLWDSWAPKPGDRVSVEEEGAPATGDMYVKRCAPMGGGYGIRADALPVPDAQAVREWRSTTLYVAIAQLAATMGLRAVFHGCDDMPLSYVRQDGEGALPVIARLCMVAGSTFDVHDGTMHVCGRDWIAAQPSTGTMEVPATSDYAYRTRQPFTTCMLTQTGIPGVRAALAASCGAAGRALGVVLDERIGFADSSGLERASAGVLACANARLSGGYVRGEALSPYSPGAVCAVSCERAPSLSGAAIVTRVRNDFANRTSKTWWRIA